jgi:hypothetical protein
MVAADYDILKYFVDVKLYMPTFTTKKVLPLPPICPLERSTVYFIPSLG